MIEQIKESIGFDLAVQQILSSIDGMIGLGIFVVFVFIFGYLCCLQDNNVDFLDHLLNWESIIFIPIAVACYRINYVRMKNWFTNEYDFSSLYLIVVLILIPSYKLGWIYYKKKFINTYLCPGHFQAKFIGGHAMICIFIPIFGLIVLIMTISHLDFR